MKTIILLLLPFQLISQDISGIWTGALHTRGNDLLYELVIDENNTSSKGYALTVFTINGVENTGLKSVTIKKKNGVIIVEDRELIYDNYSTPPKRIKQFSFLSLYTRDSLITLEGKFQTRVIDFRASDDNIYTGTVELRKRNNVDATRLIAQLDKMKLLNTLSFIPKKPVKDKPVISLAVAENPFVTPRGIINTVDSGRLKNEPPARHEAVTVLNEPKTKLVNKPAQKQPVKETIIAGVERKNNTTVTIVPVSKEIKIPPSSKQKDKQVNITSEISVIKTQPVADIKPKSSPPLREPDNAIATKAVIDPRKTEIIQTMFFNSDSLVLSLYDNGIVDGDTVTLVLNGKVLVAKQRLSENAINVILHITPDLGDSLQLTMYAENLGSIPPNTGLLIIQDGDKRNEIRFEGDLQKSSAVILRRKH